MRFLSEQSAEFHGDVLALYSDGDPGSFEIGAVRPLGSMSGFFVVDLLGGIVDNKALPDIRELVLKRTDQRWYIVMTRAAFDGRNQQR